MLTEGFQLASRLLAGSSINVPATRLLWKCYMLTFASLSSSFHLMLPGTLCQARLESF